MTGTPNSLSSGTLKIPVGVSALSSGVNFSGESSAFTTPSTSPFPQASNPLGDGSIHTHTLTPRSPTVGKTQDYFRV